ncbi:cytochrome c biogenesis protein CcmG/thiol:disulfide interchange protein DsbE [Blastococcus colisei]|uniref:Cytochrome c biogenesis protein CcmG/thiol:disulfide interchange protein DsbE n=1 Tax=Blastococcus colisei TaxID=1564162 RepID=A0A543PEP4_9ACTN|nr:TlpA disulfide reductase family protein [Blastococcus colisei]TQN42548.1 cytochrome c biogenesis protein CcmG/thiol:disulfide interchange protein DsbE [Blastococcus colisei]
MTTPTGASSESPRRRRRWPAVLVFLTVVTLVGGLFAARLGGDSSASTSALIGQPAPPLAGETLDGGRFDLADWRGEVVLVNLWASWCEPCRREHPVLTSAAEALGPRGLRIVGVDVRDDPADARAFLAEFGGARWPTLIDPEGTHAIAWGTFALPETYVVGRDGTVVAKTIGEVDAAWITEQVVPLLGGDAP